MPRKLPIPLAVAPVETLLPPIPPSPIIQLLRKDWRWAAISQFIWTFSDAFGLVDWDIEALEADFDGDEKALIPTLIAKLLFALTYNRQINRDNAFDSLRKTYAKRKPDQKCLLGTEEEPVQWETLGLSRKVQILHELCEWQLEDPARFRGLLKSEEEAVTWRVEPVGWDKDGNTYWLFDDNRLWIQRLPPPPPRPAKKTSQKAKKASKKSRPSGSSTVAPTHTAKKSHRKRQLTPELSLTPPPPQPKEEEFVSGSRRRKSVNFYGNPTPTAQALKRNPTIPTTPFHSNPAAGGGESSSARPTRSSARNTNNNHNTQVEVNGVNESPSKSKNTPLPLGTRVSRRLRNVDDEWQQIPDDWLSIPVKTSKQKKGKGKGKNKVGNDHDDDSDLSELTDEDEHERLVLASGARKVKVKSLSVEVPEVNGEDKEKEKMDVDEKENGNPEDNPGNDETAEQVAEGLDQVEDGDKSAEEQPEGQTEQPQSPPIENQPSETNPEVTTDVAPLTAPAEADEVLEGTRSEVAREADVSEEHKVEQAPALDGTIDVPVDNKEAENVGSGKDIPAEGVIQDGASKNPDDGQVGDGEPEKGITGDSSPAVPEAKEEDKVKAEIIEKKSDLILAWEEERTHIPPDFIEWEAVCVTLYEWRTFPEQFAKSKDPDEQALYTLLKDEVGPTIISILVAKEQERIKQEAVNNRKRSSRIATRELEREEILKREAAEREMEERMEKIRGEEIRKQKEEEEALMVQKAREDRLKEREERALAREEILLKKQEEELREKERKERKREKRKRRREGEEVSDDSDDEPPQQRGGRTSTRGPSANGNGNGGESDNGTPNERWELNCEVCKKVGWNIDEDLDLVCCDDCGRWQHTECHDALDKREGRRPRNWDQVDFKCKECLHRAARKRQRLDNPSQIHPPPPSQHQTNGHNHLPQLQPHTQSPYPVISGSSPGPRVQPQLDPARPPPPPLAPGEYYLPYPHPPAREDRPAGYAVFYPPNQSHISPPGFGQQQGYPTNHPSQSQSQQQRYPVTPLSSISQHPNSQPTYPSPSRQGYQISPPQQSPYHRQSHQAAPQYPQASATATASQQISPSHGTRPDHQPTYASNGPSSSRTIYSQAQHPSPFSSNQNPSPQSITASRPQPHDQISSAYQTQAQTQTSPSRPQIPQIANVLPTPQPSAATQRTVNHPA